MASIAVAQLDIEKVTVRYSARIVLKDIALTLKHGEVLVVRGANGSGKSTLLRVLCGLLLPASGTVIYRTQAGDYTPRQARHLIGWVSPDQMLYRELTARENLRFFADVRNIAGDNQQIDTLLETVGLKGRGDEYVANYSSGMVHRLRYAYALLHTPPILLLDEPTVMLDERGTEVVETIVQAQRQQGLTIIATNDPREFRFADYILSLETG